MTAIPPVERPVRTGCDAPKPSGDAPTPSREVPTRDRDAPRPCRDVRTPCRDEWGSSRDKQASGRDRQASSRVARTSSRGAIGWSRHCGSATVAVVGVIGVLFAMVVGALMVISAVVASHRAQSAADLAALGAAAVLVRGEPAVAACSTAGALASRNGAGMATCQTEPDLSVEIVVRVAATMPHVGLASARSRAGPSP